MNLFMEEFHKYAKKSESLLDSGNSYKLKEKYGAALECYLESMQHFVKAIESFERYQRFFGGVRDKNKRVYYEESPELEYSNLSSLSGLSINISTCYIIRNDVKKASFFIAFLDDIYDAHNRVLKNLTFKRERTCSFLLEKIDILKRKIKEKESSGLETIPGFSESVIFSDDSNPDILNDYYNSKFNETVEAVVKAKSLWAMGLPKEDDSVTVSSAEGCFIATAAYGAENHADIETFRDFRDSILSNNILGNSLVQAYYKIGPYLATYVKSVPILKKSVRHCLEYIAVWMRKSLL